jgi:hypothetical protein
MRVFQVPVETDDGETISVDVARYVANGRYEWVITNVDANYKAKDMEDKILWADENVHDLREQINEFIYQETR